MDTFSRVGKKESWELNNGDNPLQIEMPHGGVIIITNIIIIIISITTTIIIINITTTIIINITTTIIIVIITTIIIVVVIIVILGNVCCQIISHFWIEALQTCVLLKYNFSFLLLTAFEMLR